MTKTSSPVYLIRGRVPAFIWRLLSLATTLYALYLLVFSSSFSSQMYCYFTVQSNLMIALLFAILTVGTAVQLLRHNTDGVFHLAPALQLAVVFFIQITFLVFAAILAPGMFKMGGVDTANMLLHYVVPLMALADWLMFMPHGLIGYRHAALWLSYPAAYVVFSFIRAALGAPFFDGSRFPYFFMDADKLGWNLLWICPLFFAGFFTLGCVLVAADRLLARLLKRTK